LPPLAATLNKVLNRDCPAALSSGQFCFEAAAPL
jgi:hypothetical protein